jgi:hypothetical protein
MRCCGCRGRLEITGLNWCAWVSSTVQNLEFDYSRPCFLKHRGGETRVVVPRDPDQPPIRKGCCGWRGVRKGCPRTNPVKDAEFAKEWMTDFDAFQSAFRRFGSSNGTSAIASRRHRVRRADHRIQSRVKILIQWTEKSVASESEGGKRCVWSPEYKKLEPRQ